MKSSVKVAVSGAAGQICYSLLTRLCAGEVFGKDTMIDLRLLEVPFALKALEGVVMELHDCAFANVESITATDSNEKAFDGADYVILVGAKPRSKGMERKDLLLENGKIFASQGKALNKEKQARVLVVGNPCNTNALILKHSAPDLDPANIRCMTRLDQNRAKSLLAAKAGVNVSEVTNIAIYGNHSKTMVTDFSHGLIQQKPLEDVITDRNWLENDLFSSVQNRGAQIIEARGLSSAASAASAAIDSIKDWIVSDHDECIAAGIYSKGNPYEIDEDLFFSFPLVNDSIIFHKEMDSFLEQKIKETEKELIEEREMISSFI